MIIVPTGKMKNLKSKTLNPRHAGFLLLEKGREKDTIIQKVQNVQKTQKKELRAKS